MTSDDVATGSWSKAVIRCNHLEEVKRGTFSYMCRAGGGGAGEALQPLRDFASPNRDVYV